MNKENKYQYRAVKIVLKPAIRDQLEEVAKEHSMVASEFMRHLLLIYLHERELRADKKED